MSPPNRHPTFTLSYNERASLPNTSPLASYLLRLMHLKRTNLCLSADVSTTSELLSLASELGDSICILKTHADIITDFNQHTVRGLLDIAHRKQFLIFEDRKFGDIGNTVQKQYASGPFAIATWAHITNATIFPGPAIVSALKQAAHAALPSDTGTVSTSITAGSPRSPTSLAAASDSDSAAPAVTITHTIRRRSTAAAAPPDSLAALGAPPPTRALLLLAEMSSAGNFCTGAYTAACVALGRQHADFVLGFVAQRALNAEAGDNFVCLTPGVGLGAAAGEAATAAGEGAAAAEGDGLGQRYDTPWGRVRGCGSDVVIVGRGILRARDRVAEAERYRGEAWRAYEARVGRE